MKRACKVHGCEAVAKGYGAYCPKHKATDRRHGAPTQRGVTKAELKIYREMVRSRIDKNAENPVWKMADQRWLTVVRWAEGVVQRFAAGRPGFGWERRTAAEVLKLSEHIPAREVVETVLATYLMREQEAQRFKSDRAFQFRKRCFQDTSLRAVCGA
jgi:hypothetical protein